MENAGIIMLKLKRGKVESFSISDPTRKLTELKFTLEGLYSVKNPSIKVIKDKKTNTSQFIVQMPKGAFAGKSLSFKL